MNKKLAGMIMAMLEPLDGVCLDNDQEKQKVAVHLSAAFNPLIGLLMQARAYVDGGKDPEVEVEGIVAHAIDTALSELIEGYAKPQTVMGRKHLRPLKPDCPDWSLEALHDEARKMLAQIQATQADTPSGEWCFGFVWRGREVLWDCPLKIVPLKRITSPIREIDLLVGPTVKVLPLFQLHPTQAGLKIQQTELDLSKEVAAEVAAQRAAVKAEIAATSSP